MPDPSVVEGIFLQALEKGTADERAAFLDSACVGQVELRQEVEQLLAAHPKAAGFLEPADEKTAAYEAAGEQPGQIVAGRFKLLEQIGEGGMGTVWVAEQTQPVRRKVALKLIKAGMDSKAVIARFEAERQALALMDHPNIAKVLDGGVTENGRPFFVMEYVKGIPITTYCDNVRLSIADRLALFVPVCQAVQHAHQKGVIHRDLKPSNLLVCLYDGRPVPKVIDFGLAKAIHQPLTEHTLHTAHGVMMGTPLYMSPEQAEFNNLDVDTRTDIYALGVILYELLTGTTPLEKQRFQHAACQEMLRLIKEEEPPRPSVRLSGSDALPTLAAQRQMEPVKLGRLLRGELDWMVMKALEKDRNRRYETANAFAVDVQRYLAGEAVQAVPPSAAYRLRKFARKNRTLLSTATAFAALLIVAAAVSGWLAIKARHAEAWAEDKRIEAEANAKIAEASRNEAFHNAGLAQGALMRAEVLRRKAEITSASLQVDVDLTELQSDARVGFLRLARTLQGIPSSQSPETVPGSLYEDAEVTVTGLNDARRALREFVTFAVLATGQEYAQLLPPITHDGEAIWTSSVSSDDKWLITCGADMTARVWDRFTGRQVAILKTADEKVLAADLSIDGATAFTHALDGVVRFYSTEDWKLQAQTEARPERLKYEGERSPFEPGFNFNSHDLDEVSNDRLLAKFMLLGSSPEGLGWLHDNHLVGQAELWDTNSGKLISRLSIDHGKSYGPSPFRFIANGKWIAAESGSSLSIYSSKDGSLLRELIHREPSGVYYVVSPSGNIVISIPAVLDRDKMMNVWDTSTWHSRSFVIKAGLPSPDFNGLMMLDDELLALLDYDHDRTSFIVNLSSGTILARVSSFPISIQNGCALFESGEVFDTRSWGRILPPQGRRHCEELTRFADDGRFVFIRSNDKKSRFVDSVTQKTIEVEYGDFRHQKGRGWIAGGEWPTAPIQILRLPDRLEVPADILELWAQVAVRGELADDGAFEKWDEATWETHRLELASKPPPIPGFPFPGYAATDKLHWLRAEFHAASEKDKPRLAKQLLDRAETAGDKAEATRWQRWLQSNSEQASTANAESDQ